MTTIGRGNKMATSHNTWGDHTKGVEKSAGVAVEGSQLSTRAAMSKDSWRVSKEGHDLLEGSWALFFVTKFDEIGILTKFRLWAAAWSFGPLRGWIEYSFENRDRSSKWEYWGIKKLLEHIRNYRRLWSSETRPRGMSPLVLRAEASPICSSSIASHHPLKNGPEHGMLVNYFIFWKDGFDWITKSWVNAKTGDG